MDKQLRFRDLRMVEKELAFFLEKKVPQVKFVDRTFNCKHEHAMGIWRFLAEHDNGVTNFHFEISADLLTEEEPQVKFVDRTFNCKHEHAMGIWRFLAEHDNGVTNFHFEISADLLTEEELKLLASMRPGLVQLEIGVQSTNDATI